MKFLLNTFGSGWVNGNKEGQYRHHYKRVIFEREKSKIPQTIAVTLLEYRTNKKNRDRLRELEILRREIELEINSLKSRIKNVRINTKTNFKFICQCTYPECRGLVEAKNRKCCVCERKICGKCREPKLETHKCNLQIVENIKSIRNETKPCPKCANPIFKIDGCNQMWCTSCQTPFSWRTGEIISGNFHNPHAVEWERLNGHKLPSGGICQVLPPISNTFNECSKETFKCISSIRRVIVELESRILGYRSVTDQDYELARLKYVNNEINEEKWRQNIFLKERKNERYRVYREILGTCHLVASESYVTFDNEVKKISIGCYSGRLRQKKILEELSKEFFSSIEKIQNFTNKALMDELPPLGTKSPRTVNFFHYYTYT